jgi:RNA polymerase sigma factor (sigma-70 family)
MFFRRKNSNNETDEEIIARYRSGGDQQLVGILYERYSHLVFGVCMKYLKNRDESKDAVVNIFEKLLVDLRQHTIDNFKSWIHTVSRNYCLMQLRKSNRPGTEKDVDELSHKLEDNNNNDAEVKEEQLTHLEEGIRQLNEEQRICIELFFLQQKCYQEVVEATGFTMNQVKSFIQNGKRNLKIYLTRQNEMADQ